MKRLSIPILAAVLICGACKKQAEAPAPKPDAPAASSVDSLLNKDGGTPAPAPAASTPSNPTAPEAQAAPAQTDITPAAPSTESFETVAASSEVGDLTRALQIFHNVHHRFPADINELSRVSQIRIPSIPAGSKLVIDKESQTVKLVKSAGN